MGSHGALDDMAPRSAARLRPPSNSTEQRAAFEGGTSASPRSRASAICPVYFRSDIGLTPSLEGSGIP